MRALVRAWRASGIRSRWSATHRLKNAGGAAGSRIATAGYPPSSARMQFTRGLPRLRDTEYDQWYDTVEREQEEPEATAEDDDGGDDDDRDEDGQQEPVKIGEAEQAVADRLWGDVHHLRFTNVAPLVKQWIDTEPGFGLPGVLYILNKLRSSRRLRQASMTMDWLFKERPFGDLSESLMKLHIKLAAEAGNMARAQEAFYSLSPEQQSQGIKSSLIVGYATRCMLNRAEELLKKFEPRDAEPYWAVIKLCCKVGQYEKAVGVYEDMKKAGLGEDIWTVAYLLREKDKYSSLGQLNSIQGLEEAAQAILSRGGAYHDSVEVKRQSVAAQMMNLAAQLGKEPEVNKLWSRIKQDERVRSSSYVSAIDSFAAIGDLKMAKQVAQEMETNKKSRFRLSLAVIRMYARLGMMDKAEEALSEYAEDTRVRFSHYYQLMMGYLVGEQPDKAVATMNRALRDPRARPTYLSLLNLLPAFEALKDAGGADRMVTRYRGVTDVRVYKGLLRVYVAAKKKPLEEFEARMVMKDVEPDEATRKLMRRLQRVTS